MTSAVIVKWFDAAATHGWHHIEKVDPRPTSCETIGWLARETKETITVALSRGLEGATPFGDFITIPRGCVRSVKRIKV